MRSRTSVWPVVTIVLTGVALCAACGMKGPPLAPLVILPNAVDDLEVRRLGSHVYLQFAVPAANTDGSRPPDLELVEVYGLTTDPEQDPATDPPLDDWLEAATLVATFHVSRPELEPEDLPESGDTIDPGEQVVVVETLAPELVEPYVFEDDSDEDSDDAESDEIEESPIMPLLSPPLPRPPRRTYLVRGVSTRGRESAPSARAVVPTTDPTPPPPPPTITYTETEFLVEWTPATGARRPIQAPDEGDPSEIDEGDEGDDEGEAELGDFAIVTDEPREPDVVTDEPREPDVVTDEDDDQDEAEERLPSRPVIPGATPSDYLVYTVTSTRSGEVPILPAPLNMPKVGAFSYRDRAMRFGAERCYVVRVRDVLDSLRIEGPASPPTCVVPVDTFPPRPPTGLVAVASEGAISLVWDPNPERDIAGYLVLRRASTGATLETLTPDPIEGTSYRDATVTADEGYVYAVRAVDNATPYNTSVPSPEITEQAR